MKKILIVGDFLTGSGLTRFIFNVFENMTDYKIYAIGYGWEKSKAINEKCKAKGWIFRRVIPVTSNPIKHWLAWKQILTKNKFDIIYFNYSSSWNFLPLKIAKKYQHAKIVCHSHNSFYSHVFKNRFLMCMLNILNNVGKREFYKNANVKIATSKKAARWMFGTNKNVNIINNGIRISDFIFDVQSRKSLRKKLGLTSNDILVGFVGVLQKRKNPLFVVDVFNELHKEKSQSKLIMIGKGELKPNIINKIQKLGLTNCVNLVDYSEEVNKWYSAMDILIFPSLYEGFGLVPLEAQVSNLPVIVSTGIPVCVTTNIFEINNFNLINWKNKLLKICSRSHSRTSKVYETLYKYSSQNQLEIIERLLK